MVFKELIRYSGLAVGLKPSAMVWDAKAACAAYIRFNS